MTNAERAAVTPPVHFAADEQRRPLRPIEWRLPREHPLYEHLTRGYEAGSKQEQKIIDPPIHFDKLGHGQGYAVSQWASGAEIISARHSESNIASVDGVRISQDRGNSNGDSGFAGKQGYSSDKETEVFPGYYHSTNLDQTAVLIGNLGGETTSLLGDADRPLNTEEFRERASGELTKIMSTDGGMGKFIGTIVGTPGEDGEPHGGLNRASLKALSKVKSSALDGIGLGVYRDQLEDSNLVSKVQKAVDSVYTAASANLNVEKLEGSLKDILHDLGEKIPPEKANAFALVFSAGLIGAIAYKRREDAAEVLDKLKKAAGDLKGNAADFVDKHGVQLAAVVLILAFLASCTPPPPGTTAAPTSTIDSSGQQLVNPTAEPTAINGVPTEDLQRVGASCSLDQLAKVFGEKYGAGEYVSGAQGMGQTVPVLTGEGLESLIGAKLDQTGVDAEIQTEVKNEIGNIVDAKPGVRRILVPDFVDPEWVKQAIMAERGLSAWDPGIEIVKYEKGMDMGQGDPLLVAPHMRPGGRAIAIWDDPVVTDEQRPDGSFMVDGKMMRVVANSDGGKELWGLPGQKADGLHAEVFIYDGCNPLVVLVDSNWNVVKVLAAGDLNSDIMNDPAKVWVEADADGNGAVVQILPTPTSTQEPVPESTSIPEKQYQQFDRNNWHSEEAYIPIEDLDINGAYYNWLVKNWHPDLQTPDPNVVSSKLVNEKSLWYFGGRGTYAFGFSYGWTKCGVTWGGVSHDMICAVVPMAVAVPGKPGEVRIILTLNEQSYNGSDSGMANTIKDLEDSRNIMFGGFKRDLQSGHVSLDDGVDQIDFLNKTLKNYPDIMDRFALVEKDLDLSHLSGPGLVVIVFKVDVKRN